MSRFLRQITLANGLVEAVDFETIALGDLPSGTGTVVSVTAGSGLTGGTISSSGTIALANTAVVPGTYGDASDIPVLTVNQQGQLTAVSTIPVTGGGAGAAGVNGAPGPAGAPGAPGATWYQGAGAPAATQGNVNDFYLNTLVGDVWNKQIACFGVPPAWKKVANIVGPAGKAGAQGAPGQQGVQGAQGAASSSSPRGYIDGLTIAYVSTTQFSVSKGLGRDSTNAADLVLGASGLVKTTGAWAAGNGAGGLDTGSIGASTWYKVFIIGSAGGPSDIIFTTAAAATGPAMPAGYTYFRYIGSLRTNASKNWLQYTQVGDTFTWFDATNDASGASVATTFTALTLSYAPAGISVTAMLYVAVQAAAAASDLAIISGYGDSSQSPSTTPLTYCALGPAAGILGFASILVQTDTTPKIYVGGNSSLDTYYLAVLGYIDPRGKNF